MRPSIRSVEHVRVSKGQRLFTIHPFRIRRHTPTGHNIELFSCGATTTERLPYSANHLMVPVVHEQVAPLLLLWRPIRFVELVLPLREDGSLLPRAWCGWSTVTLYATVRYPSLQERAWLYGYMSHVRWVTSEDSTAPVKPRRS